GLRVDRVEAHRARRDRAEGAGAHAGVHVRRGLAAAALAAATCSVLPTNAAAQVELSPAPPRQVALFLVSGMSFEQFMGVPQFRSLARAGGAGLMSFRTVRGDEGPGPVLTLNAGARSSVPFGTVRIVVGPAHRIHVLSWRAIVDANLHRSTPGLLGAVLEANGMQACADSGRSA